MIGNEPDRLELYGPGEIMSGHEFYDYAAKYTPGLSRDDAHRRGPADQRADDAQARAGRVPRGGLRGLRPRSTSCWRARPLVVSEINTIPGFTPISLFPALCAAGGYDFAAVCRRVVDLALDRDLAASGTA